MGEMADLWHHGEILNTNWFRDYRIVDLYMTFLDDGHLDDGYYVICYVYLLYGLEKKSQDVLWKEIWLYNWKHSKHLSLKSFGQEMFELYN